MKAKVGSKDGFTLTELMIVVAIIGLLAAIALPNLVKAREGSTNARYIGDLRTAKGAFELYAIEQGRYPGDVTPGIMPAGMQPYLGSFKWRERNSLGGLWDWDNGQFGVQAGVSVYQPTASLAQLTQLDKTIDDGNLATGSFRSRASGYISIMQN